MASPWTQRNAEQSFYHNLDGTVPSNRTADEARQSRSFCIFVGLLKMERDHFEKGRGKKNKTKLQTLILMRTVETSYRNQTFTTVKGPDSKESKRLEENETLPGIELPVQHVAYPQILQCSKRLS